MTKLVIGTYSYFSWRDELIKNSSGTHVDDFAPPAYCLKVKHIKENNQAYDIIGDIEDDAAELEYLAAELQIVAVADNALSSHVTVQNQVGADSSNIVTEKETGRRIEGGE